VDGKYLSECRGSKNDAKKEFWVLGVGSLDEDKARRKHG
jgi:hypothetical protein